MANEVINGALNPIFLRTVQDVDKVRLSKRIIISGTKTYICETAFGLGTNVSLQIWRIKEVDETDANNITVKWASGTTAFDKVSDNYASYTYA